MRHAPASGAIVIMLRSLKMHGMAERLSTTEKTHEIQRQMLDAASHHPRDRDDLAQHMRDGRF